MMETMPQGRSAQPPSGRRVVLVVEDDEETAVGLREALDLMGYESDVATNGKVALDYLRRTPSKYCVVLLDIMMPVMDGWNFLKERKAEGTMSGIPVIVVTAVLDDRSRAVAAGAVAFLQKPLDLSKLHETLRQYC
jgi:DNA-binding response OmpR family regulator